jgi:hypothetical protein
MMAGKTLSLVLNGETYVLKSESKWLRRYWSPSGNFHIVSKALDPEFDWEILLQIDPKTLSERELRDAALAIHVASPPKEIPDEWKIVVQNWLQSLPS